MASQNRAATCLASVHPPLPTTAALKYSNGRRYRPGSRDAKGMRLCADGTACLFWSSRAPQPAPCRAPTPTEEAPDTDPGGRRSEAERMRLLVFSTTLRMEGRYALPFRSSYSGGLRKKKEEVKMGRSKCKHGGRWPGGQVVDVGGDVPQPKNPENLLCH